MARVPRATYRLQLNAGFTFNDARAIAPYLAELGISDVYASPILRARKGSEHGYDIVDAHALNPELGSEEDFAALDAELKRLGMGLLLDVVPNHMAASHENAWWMSVLENGRGSRVAHYFDIDWRNDKLLLPILGKPYGEVLEAGEIAVGFGADGYYVSYYDKRLPLAPESYALVLAEVPAVPEEVREVLTSTNSKYLKESLLRIHDENEAFREAHDAALRRFGIDALDRLLDAQHYRLAYWRIASETINYRRFFDVTDLVGVRVEEPEVFDARSRRIFDLVSEGKVTGLRIDHIDGLHDPLGHMRKLQARLGDDFYIVVEKILAADEALPRAFPVAGTTGYEHASAVNALFIDPAGLRQLDDFYRAFTGERRSFDDLCYEKKKLVLQDLFSGEMRALGEQLAAVAMTHRKARDYAPVELTAALAEITACLKVYRTYVRDDAVSDVDRGRIAEAVSCARARAAGLPDRERLFEFVHSVLLLEPPEYVSDRKLWLDFVMRWQQFTGRVMAKGVEDTAFYNYNRLVSMNEVGGEPGRIPEDAAEELHRFNERRAAEWPHTLNATSTHDTKRSEDVRARINVLSEIPDVWTRQVRRWSRMVPFPHPNDQLLIFQTLAGAWPLDRDRLRQYLEKSAREAKTLTSWIAPNEEYEKALFDYGDALLGHEQFVAELTRFVKRIAWPGAVNALAQLVLKATSPGVPDFYQGTELWDDSLVDPDNRRPVDYAQRAALLRKLKSATPQSLVRRWQDGRIKLFTTWKLLALRDRLRDAPYTPLDAGPNVFAFTRGDVAVAVPRPPRGESSAAPLLTGRWRHVFTGEERDSWSPQDLFARFPVGVVERA